MCLPEVAMKKEARKECAGEMGTLVRRVKAILTETNTVDSVNFVDRVSQKSRGGKTLEHTRYNG